MSKSMQHFDNRPIGIFDSGLGGLTVAAALRKKLPNEAVVYLGDTARVPYGNKSADSIIRFAREDVKFMLSRGVKMVVAACNTVSSVAMNDLHHTYPDEHIIGVIESGVRAAIRSGARKITVIGTRATVNSDSYRRSLHALDRAVKVESIACPLLVPLAEEGITSGPVVAQILDIYLASVKRNLPDALLLGCTHYPLFQQTLREYFDGKVNIIDSASACADFVADFLAEHEMAATTDNPPVAGFFVTDLPSEFNRHATKFLGYVPEQIEKINLQEF